MKIKFIGKAKLTSQGQVTVPNEARKILNISNNSELYWYIIDEKLIATSKLMSIEELEKKLKVIN